MREIAPGLYHWSAPHPSWDPDGEPGSADDWPQEVGSTLWRGVFIDPQVPDSLWPELDALVDGPVVVLTTIRFHGRSRDAVLSRYGGGETLPDGVEAFPMDGFQETIYWLPEPRALVPGDLLIGDGEGGIRMCPESWLRAYLPGGASAAELREALRPLLELPVEHVLASHWSPVIGRGHAALERALGDQP
jgi:hypothetical protein